MESYGFYHSLPTLLVLCNTNLAVQLAHTCVSNTCCGFSVDPRLESSTFSFFNIYKRNSSSFLFSSEWHPIHQDGTKSWRSVMAEGGWNTSVYVHWPIMGTSACSWGTIGEHEHFHILLISSNLSCFFGSFSTRRPIFTNSVVLIKPHLHFYCID